MTDQLHDYIAEEDIFQRFSPVARVRTVHDHGVVKLVDMMPRMVPKGRDADFAIVRAARTSTGQGLKSIEKDRQLLDYMYRNKHSTPFESIQFQFYMRMPIFVARQFVRHRTAKINEFSGRYAEMPDLTYVPDANHLLPQSTTNKQGGASDGPKIDVEYAAKSLEDSYRESRRTYQELLELGLARETSRLALPLAQYTEWYFSLDLRNLLHFFTLRCDPHAQLEARDYANAMLEVVTPYVPYVIELWRRYDFESIRFDSVELELIQKPTQKHPRMSERAMAEFTAKLERIGIGHTWLTLAQIADVM